MEQEIRNVASLIDAVRHAETVFEGQVWARGHSDANWKLLPGAHRKPPILETQIAQMFRLRAPARYEKCPTRTDLPAWLTLMRHYGLSTRLLDWSESSIVAAFFAVETGPRDRNAAIWLLSPGKLNLLYDESLIPLLSSPSIRNLVEGAFNWRLEGDKVLAVGAPQIDLRMAMQLSHYTIPGHRDPLEDHPKASSYLRKLVIPRDAMDEFNGDLSILGIRRSIIFPDLENLAAELEELVAFDANETGLLRGEESG
jgi:hypothetical protein